MPDVWQRLQGIVQLLHDVLQWVHDVVQRLPEHGEVKRGDVKTAGKPRWARVSGRGGYLGVRRGDFSCPSWTKR